MNGATKIYIHNSSGVEITVKLPNGGESHLASGLCWVFSSETVTISPRRFYNLTFIPVESELGNLTIQVFYGHVTIIQETNLTGFTAEIKTERTDKGEVWKIVEITRK